MPPTLALPTPPGHARTLSVSAYNLTGLKPSLKYGPTGERMANSLTCPGHKAKEQRA